VRGTRLSATTAGERIRSKGELRSYLEERGVARSVVEEKLQKAEFGQTFARRFILLNSADCPDDGDTSRDELIALAMQESFDQELRLGGSGHGDRDDDGNDPDFISDGESLGSQDSDDIGDVAVGGWRQRQSEQEQETAEDYDISCLEVKTLTAAEDGCCAVCQSDWEAGDEMRILPCDHKFHTSCIDQWLRKHKASCPLCKKDVREDWEDMGEEVYDPVSGTWQSADGEDSVDTHEPGDVR
jgi:hypothetical protein